VIENTLLDFNINDIKSFSFEFNNIAVRQKYTSKIGDLDHTHIDTSTSEKIYSWNGGQSSFIIYNYDLLCMDFSGGSTYGARNYKLNVQFSKTKGIINSLYYEYYTQYPSSEFLIDTKSNEIRFENFPYTIVYNKNGKAEIVADLIGKVIDNYLPYIYNYYSSVDGKGPNYSSTETKLITKKDPLTGKEINYYPATDSSRIKFVLN
jgi:hypothetical protein